MPFMNDLFIEMDDVLGCGQVNHDGKWWFDVEKQQEGKREPDEGFEPTLDSAAQPFHKR